MAGCGGKMLANRRLADANLEFNELKIFLEIARRSGYHVGSKEIRRHQVLLLCRDLPGIQREDTNFDLMSSIAEYGLCGTRVVYMSPHSSKRIRPLNIRLEKAKRNVERRINKIQTR